MDAIEFFKKVGIDAVRSYVTSYDDYLTDDLKRLLVSHFFVYEHGTLERAKEYAHSKYTAPEVADRLKQAIVDVESCQ